jgi:hypothetical protein
MSLFDDASLAMIPSAYKDGKLYSIKPTDGSGDFTFTRGSNLAATRVDVNGLIEKGRENLLLQSNQFDTTWAIYNSVSVLGGQSGYDGGSDAWLLQANAANGHLRQTITSVSGIVTYSIYAKPNSLNAILIQIKQTSDAYAYFDLSDGSLLSNTNLIDSSIVALSNGWYRVSITANVSASTQIRLYPSQDSDTSITSGSIYIQDAQLELGLVATDYIETTTTTAQAGILEDMPRLDYIGGASCPSLLLEPQRTNLLTHSEYYGGGDWLRTRCGFVTNTSETLSPEGLYNASKMTSTDASESYAQNNVTLGSTSGTFTFFAKKGDLDYCHALVWDISANGRRQWFNLATGAVGTTTNFGSGYTKVDATIKDCGNGWYRCSFSWSGGNTTSGVRINISSGDGVIDSPINSYGYFYGAQCEASVSYPTSYIPTYGTSQTRSADDMDTTFSSPFATNGSATFFIQLDATSLGEGNSNTRNFSLDFESGDYITYNRGTNSVHRLKVDASGTSYYSTSGISSVYADDPVKMAAVVTATSVVMYVNGAEAINTSLVGNWDSADLLRTSLTDLLGIMPVKQFVFFPTALTDSECIALTTI